MLDTLTRGFRAAKQRLTGVAELDEQVIDEALQPVRMSLLEADVNLNVVKEFLAKVREKTVGEEVRLRAKTKDRFVITSPEQQFVKICLRELTELMGPVDTSIRFAKKGPTGILLAGLQGSGKTTTVGKLARYLIDKQKKRPLLVAADIYRPAAIDQLKIIGEQLGVPVYSEEGARPQEICEHAVKYAREKGRDVVIFDTAGRLALDEALMTELAEIDERTQPANIFLVCDAMIGQDAVNTAKSFNERIDLDGVILTKLDGDARGGAALSIKAVTGKPIKFLGMGENLDKLEEFRPEGLASRILGMGDIVGLMQDFEEVVDAEKAEEDALRMLRGKFDMQDFLEQVGVLKKMGSFSDLLAKMPFFPDGLPEGVTIDDNELVKIEAIISSMTAQERSHPELFVVTSWEQITDQQGRAKRKRAADFEPDRVRRVARGAGRKEIEVKELLDRFATMRQMMLSLGHQSGLLGKVPGLRQLSQMKQLAGMDLSRLMPQLAGGGMPGLGGLGGMGAFGSGGRAPIRNVAKAKIKAKRKKQKQDRKRSKRKK